MTLDTPTGKRQNASNFWTEHTARSTAWGADVAHLLGWSVAKGTTRNQVSNVAIPLSKELGVAI